MLSDSVLRPVRQDTKRGRKGTAVLSDFRDKEKRDTPGQVKLEKELGALGVRI